AGPARPTVLPLAELVEHRDQVIHDRYFHLVRPLFLSLRRLGLQLFCHPADRLLPPDAGRYRPQTLTGARCLHAATRRVPGGWTASDLALWFSTKRTAASVVPNKIRKRRKPMGRLSSMIAASCAAVASAIVCLAQPAL